MPFCAVVNKYRRITTGSAERPAAKLTGDGGQLGEAAEDLGVDVDAQLLLVHQPLVARLEDAPGPVRERLPHQRVRQVDEPLPRQLPMLIRLGQVGETSLVALNLLKDVLDAEALVLWQRQVLNPVVVDEALAAADDALQEVDGVALKRC